MINPVNLELGVYELLTTFTRQISSNTTQVVLVQQFIVQSGLWVERDTDLDAVPDSVDVSVLSGATVENSVDKNLIGNHRIGNSRLEGASSVTRLTVGLLGQQRGASTSSVSSNTAGIVSGYDTQIESSSLGSQQDSFYTYGTDLYDIQITNLPTKGLSSTLVLTLNSSLSAASNGAVRYIRDSVWTTVAADRVYYSAVSPSATSQGQRDVNTAVDCANATYRQIPQRGDTCVRVVLDDGGAHDY